jgi:hypothetical protein
MLGSLKICSGLIPDVATFVFIKGTVTEEIALLVASEYIQKMYDSILGRGSDHTTEIFHNFPQSLQEYVWSVHEITPERCLPVACSLLSSRQTPCSRS